MLRYLFHPRRIVISLLIITFILLCIHLLCVYASFILDSPYSFSWKFYFDKRMNIPFFFSVGLLLLSAYFTYKISVSPFEIPSRLEFWKTLCILIGFIALDKFFHLHNKARTITSAITSTNDATSPFYYLWTIPYLAFIGYIGVRLKRSFVPLPEPIKKQLITACALFATGAIVLEVAGIYYAHLHSGESDLYHVLIKTSEDLLQILGTVMLIYSLIRHFRRLETRVP
jgi:hypothetical protein